MRLAVQADINRVAQDSCVQNRMTQIPSLCATIGKRRFNAYAEETN